MRRVAGSFSLLPDFSWFSGSLAWTVGLTGWAWLSGHCRDAGEFLLWRLLRCLLTRARIVEYATREQAQNAVNTLSNQNLMGRLVYVREVCADEFFRRV